MQRDYETHSSSSAWRSKQGCESIVTSGGGNY